MRKLPLALVLGLAIGIAGLLAIVAMRLVDNLEDVQRLGLLASGAWFAERVLVAAGLFALAARTTGRARSALRIAAWATVGCAIWNFVRPLVLVDSRASWHIDVARWGFAFYGACLLASAIALVVAARGFSRAVAASVTLLVTVLVYGWIPYVSDGLSGLLFRNRIQDVYYLADGLLAAAATLALARLVANDAVEPTTDPHAAARGLHLIAAALRLRVVVAIAIAVLGAGMVPSIATLKLAIVLGPACAVATMLAMAIAAQRVADANVEHLSPGRMTAAAALLLWWCGAQLDQITAVYERLHDPWADRDAALPMMILGPLIAIGGVALVGGAIARFAKRRAEQPLYAAALARTVLFVMLAATGVVIEANLGRATTHDTLLALTLFGAAVAIGALLVFARLAKLAAGTIESASSLPPARVVERS